MFQEHTDIAIQDRMFLPKKIDNTVNLSTCIEDIKSWYI